VADWLAGGENARTPCICIAHAGFILLWESLPNRTAAEQSGATAGRCAVPDRVWAGAKRAAGWPWPGLATTIMVMVYGRLWKSVVA